MLRKGVCYNWIFSWYFISLKCNFDILLGQDIASSANFVYGNRDRENYELGQLWTHKLNAYHAIFAQVIIM